tara:strand:- start:32 stop:544 length:513 start_codon:yes stop_codon:yes gene_type:complete
MEYGQMMNEAKDNAKLAFYQNPGYQLERREKKIMIIDVEIDTDTNFSVSLHEPLLIDRHSDILLDSFTTFNAKNNKEDGSDHMAFLMSINEFNIQSNSSQSNSFNRIIIPNNATTDNTVTTHKTKKFNYICSINPGKLSQISGKITNLANAAAFIGSGRFIAEFMVVARD